MTFARPQISTKPGYKPQAEDTSIETDLLTFYLLRHQVSFTSSYLLQIRPE